jgi:hypothetical protein
MRSSDVIIDYTNYKGVRAERRVLPKSFTYDKTEHHPETQWLMIAFDYGKGANRTFAMRDIHSWKGTA